MARKILHLISSPYGLGGAEKLLLDMAEFYDTEKYSIYYCNLFNSSQKHNLFSEALNERNLPNFDVKGHRFQDIPSIISQLLDIIKKNGIDIIQTHLHHASIIGGIVRKLNKNHKTVITQHYTREAADKYWTVALDKINAKAAGKIIAVSPAVKSDLIAQGVKAGKITVVQNGIALDKFDRETERENPLLEDLIKQGKFIIGSVGNLHKRKDHATLIKAMEEVVKKFPDAHLVIIGEGPERKNLEKLAADNNLKNNITLTGFQDSAPSLIKKFDLYVHSAKAEPFGIAVLEAMAAGKGVIATSTEGVVDIVEKNSTGFLVPPENPSVMADFIRRAIGMPEQMAKMGLNGRLRVEEKFRIENTVREYQKVYDGIYQ